MLPRLGLILILSLTLAVSNADVFEECNGVEVGNYVASSQSCASYIYCDGDESIKDDCGEGLYFNGETCEDKDKVECLLDNNEGGEAEGGEVDGNEGEGEGEGEGEEEGEEEGEGEGEGEGGEGEGEVEGGEVEETGVTDAPEVAPGTTQIATEITAINTQTPAEVPPIVKDTCPQVDDPNQIVFIASNNSCTDYYVCYHGQAHAMHCMDHLHFNLATGKCDFPENANCKLAIQPPSEFNRCLPHMTEFFPHPIKCNYFYYCIKGYQTLQQCPFFYGWDIVKRTCVHMAHAKCYNDGP